MTPIPANEASAPAKARIPGIAGMFVGWVTEVSKSNDGPWVEAIQRVTGNRKGDPWCASFVTFVLDIAFGGPKANPLARSASCDVLLEDARKKGWLTDTPAAGDVFLLMRTDTDAVHTGFVTDVGRLSVKTIEGNTNGGGSREGWGVFARERRISGSLKFIRIPSE